MNQRIDNKKSLLWKIEGNHLPQASYIFGTIHLICEKDFEIKDKVKYSIDKCTKLALELNLSSQSEMELLGSLSYSDQKISDQLNEEEKIELDEILKKDYQLSLSEVEYLAPIMIINLMIKKAVECEEQKVFELELIEMAQNNEMEITGLESANEQMNIADEIYTPSEIIRQLKESEGYGDLFIKMIDAYKEEDITLLSELVNDHRFMTPVAIETLVTDRNRRWVHIMQRMMLTDAVFFAVGAGHLPGEDGVLQLLHNAGYTVTPVFA